jgi:hypothetical protein
MTDDPFEIPDDPLGCRDDLRDAVADPDVRTAGPGGERTAYRLAVAMGRCRLFGVAPGDDLDGILPASLAVAAATELARCLDGWTAEADRLGERWDAARDPAEADDLCAGLLGNRMDAWAASLALDEAYHDGAAEGSPQVEDVGTALDRAYAALDRLDEALERQTDVLATITGTRLLKNWRALLAPAFAEDLPWWLDGRLEEAAGRSDAEAVRTLPGAGLWAAVRRQVGRFSRNRPMLPPVGTDVPAAADTPGIAVAVPGQTLGWLSPDGAWRAELQLPEEFTSGEENRSRPLNFTNCADDRPAAELAGRPVLLAGVHYTISDKGQVWLRLADLRAANGLCLSIGLPPEEWPPAPPGD